MIIYQLLLGLTYGDAVSNDVLAIDSLLKELNFSARIMAFTIDEPYKNCAQLIDVKIIKDDDIVIYHKAMGGKLNFIFKNLTCKKILRYHNITPGVFFKPYRPFLAFRLEQGRKQLKKIAKCTDFSIPVSEYNKRNLIDAGFNPQNISVIPFFINVDDYSKSENANFSALLKKRKGTKILFTGRVSPNKKHEDCIKVFYYYKNFVDPDAQLYFVGSTRTSEKYYAKLQGFVADLKLSDVYFLGHIPFESIISIYKNADVFLCMSEHEGFCVPLIEAMYFNVPIIAYASSAVPETLNGSGILHNHKDFIAFSESIRNLMQNNEYRTTIIEGQKKRLEFFDRKNLREIFITAFKTILQKINE